MYLIILCLFNLYSHNPSFGGRLWDTKVHNINGIEFWITNYGKLGPCYCPPGSGYNYMWGSGIWVGAIDSIIGDTLVTIGYGPSGGESEFAPGLYLQDPFVPYVIIYMYPQPWPAPPETFPMAPQEPVSDQDSWCCYNDCDSIYHIPNDTKPIGIEVYQTVYVWADSLPWDMIFLTFEIKNVLHKPIKDLYIGYCTDIDIGNETAPYLNDICSAIVGQWYVINGESIWVDNLAYQWETEPEPGWDESRCVIGIDLLQTPFDLQWGQDKDNDGIPDQYERDSAYYVNNLPPDMWDVDNDGLPDWRDASENPQMGMTAFKRFTLAIEPNKDNERYLTLAGYNFQTGQYEPYDTIPPQPDDQRFLMASGPFELMPDSSVIIVLGIMITCWDTLDARPDTAIVLADRWAQLYYNLNWSLGISENRTTRQSFFDFSIKPTILQRYTKAFLSLRQSELVKLKIYDPLGRCVKEVYSGYCPAGKRYIDIDLQDLASGMYLLSLEKNKKQIIKKFIKL